MVEQLNIRDQSQNRTGVTSGGTAGYSSCQLSIYTGVPGGKDNILGGHSIGHSKQKTLYEHVSYSERFPR
jgi:hypothetical protein